MKRTIRSLFLASSVLALLLGGCGDEGPAERAGEQMDEAMDELTEGEEGTLERTGRQMDETLDEAEEELDQMREEMQE